MKEILSFPSKWEVKRLEEIAANTPYPIGDGDHGQIKPKDYTTEGIPYIRVGDMGWGQLIPKKMVYIPKDVHLRNLKSKLLPGDILLAKTGATIGKCCIIPNSIKEANTTSSVGKITVDKNKVLPEWVLLWFLTPNFLKYIWSISNRAAQPGFNNRDIKLFEIPVPSISEQKCIVSILNETLVAISKAKVNAEQNLQNAKELFSTYSNEKYLSALDSYDTASLNELAKLVRGPFGGSLTKSMFSKSGYAVYEQRNAINQIDDDFRYFVDESKYRSMERFSVRAGDMLMSCSGTIGKFVVLNQNPIKGIINQALLKITADNSKVDTYFLLFVLNCFISRSSGLTQGAAIKNIVAVKELKTIKVPLPDIKTQKEIMNQLEALKLETNKLEANYQQKIFDLDELKKSVLQRAFAGELQISKLEVKI